MSDQTVVPVLGKDSFSCPYCGAYAHQDWMYARVSAYAKGAAVWSPADAKNLLREFDAGQHKDVPELRPFFEKIASGLVQVENDAKGEFLNARLVNLAVSRCFSCKKLSVWVGDNLIFPARDYPIKPHEDMPDDVAADFNEAAAIVEASPRGAAALVRLSIQRLMPHLGEKGKDLNADIGSLVKKGLDAKIQKALDVVRVIGNNAVHPGQIDLKDNKAIALKLFGLVNLIVESQISTPKHIKAMYDDLPESALDGIAKRDKDT